MPFEHAPAAAGWSARLALGFASRGEATVLARREHRGPLVVQKALHPEGPAVCHAILVHPPSGLAGGDALDVDIEASARAHALITTPGAGKWYRSTGGTARQAVVAHLRDASVLEWLPQEAIVFDGARASMAVDVRMSAAATFVGVEVLCLGRTASGERFRRGCVDLATRLDREGVPVWRERGSIEGGGAVLASPAGLRGEPVVATLLAASPRVDASLVDAMRNVRCEAGAGAVTRLPDLLVARWLGPACEPAREWLARLWSIVRPALCGRDAVRPRIWNT